MTWTLLRHLLDLPDSSRFVVLKSASFKGGSTHRLQCVGALSRIAEWLVQPPSASRAHFLSTRQFSFRQIAADYVWQRTEGLPA